MPKATKTHHDELVDDDGPDVQGYATHNLGHALNVDGIAIITYNSGTGDTRCTFRMGCHVEAPGVESEIAQAFRQACAMLSRSLRERYVERTVGVDDEQHVPMAAADDPVDGETAVDGDAVDAKKRPVH